MNRDAIEEVSIPIFIAGIAMLIASGFIVSAREWVQTRIGNIASAHDDNSAAPATPGTQGDSGFGDGGGSGQGGGGGGGGTF